MNLFAFFREAIIEQVAALAHAGRLPAGLDYSAITVEPPRDPSHGDVATNAAMVLAKPAKMPPRELAQLLAEALGRLAQVDRALVAGPGFINLSLKSDFWLERLREILREGAAYGDCAIGQGAKVNIEYVSANPTGPLHVGHGRGAVFGDALANLMEKAGFMVTHEYYVNDSGVGLEKYDLRASGQIEKLARSVYFRYRELLGDAVGSMPEGLYPGEYLIPVAKEIVTKFGRELLTFPQRGQDDPKKGWMELCANEGVEAMMDLIRTDLDALGIHFEPEEFIRERDLHRQGKVQAAVNALITKGLVYTGQLAPPKGKLPDDWEPREQLLFRASAFGDDTDRPLQKSDGSWTYFAADLAYHYDKFQRGFRVMIDVWGADHGGYVKRVKAGLSALSGGQADLDVKICQLVNLMDGGEALKMSKRAGSFITLREVIDRVGRDVVRFIMLTRRNDAALDFDFQKVTEQSKDNPVFYVQYAHARISSVLRNADQAMSNTDLSIQALSNADLTGLNHPAEVAMIKLLASWPRQVEAAALAHEPHRIAFYLNDVAAALHGLWTLGNEDASLRFIQEQNPGLTAARLALARAVAAVIASGLNIIGVAPVEEMH
jgi:arginyl-tRNA synthetase